MIEWNRERTHGVASLESVRQLYRSNRIQPADGREMPFEPERGHIFRSGTESEPVIITSIDYNKQIVNFVRLSERITKYLNTGDAELRPGAIAIPAGVRNHG